MMTVATSSPNGGPELRGQIPDYGKRMPGLDVVRGIAIAAVLFYHGVATDWMIAGVVLPAWQRAFLDHFRYGGFGVHLFYVLSGFLIAGILLDTRADSNYYKNFYLRRLLRIVPAYLLMIVVLKVFGAISWAYLAACLLFICNMPRLLHASKEYGPFWSLSVEEQFYLTWPFIIRKLSVQNVFRLCVGIILFAPLLRYGVQFCLLRSLTFATRRGMWLISSLQARFWRSAFARLGYYVPGFAKPSLSCSVQAAFLP